MEKKIIEITLKIEIEIEPEMSDLFEEVFWEVGRENNCTEWYEIFDSKLWDIVCKRIASRYGYSVFETADFQEWANEMANEL